MSANPCMNAEQTQALLDEARAAREKAYVPYSRFQVGAALQTSDGAIYHGCNVENASFGLTNCAERTAFFRAIADGHRPGDFVALAVVGDTRGPIAPCGACRQVILETEERYNQPMRIYLYGKKEIYIVESIRSLLPLCFGKSDLPE